MTELDPITATVAFVVITLLSTVTATMLSLGVI